MFEIIQMMKSNIKRADNIVRALMEFSRAGELNLKAEDINSVLESSLGLVRYKITAADIEIFKELASDLPKVSIDSNKIEQVFINLLLNAVEAMSRGGKLFMRSYLIQLNDSKNDIARKNGGYLELMEKAVVVQIEDTGSGISKDNLRKVFDPFFTTKGPKEGVGLGLAVTKNIIDMHKGIIDIESRVGKGTKVSVILKLA
jgi:signal transduction histidine kinase